MKNNHNDKRFTQEDVDRIVNDRLARERITIRRKLTRELNQEHADKISNAFNYLQDVNAADTLGIEELRSDLIIAADILEHVIAGWSE